MNDELRQVGQAADLAINHALIRSLEDQIARERRDGEKRARAAYEAGLRRGRAAWPLALMIGAGVGGTLAAILVAWLSS